MDTNESNSILDKILSSKQQTDMEQFNPSETISLLLKELTGKEEDILRRRHGLSGKETQTLEEIGALYQVTRERIRQIEGTAVKKIRRAKVFDQVMHQVQQLLTTTLTARGGIMEEEALLEHLLSFSGPSDMNRRAVIFVLSELLKDTVELMPESETMRRAWKLKGAGLDLLRQTVRELVSVVTKIGHPVELPDLLQEFRQTEFAKIHEHALSDDMLHSALQLGKDLGRNPFDEYGLTSWGSISPRRMNDKIYLILKKEGQPLHFTEIAKRINTAGFDPRKAYPPTVHNELILNKEYVLVGRGIYALREWGYKEGVVAEVLADILRKKGEPMSREALVAEVLSQRVVKKNTIHLALTNRQMFTRLDNGDYTLTQTPPEIPTA
ncbi:MAG: hypothetical protein H6760_02680 [Candidatus Nomurabacteria bacterium]|nr:MAG: hypothetical protein H6760_02680 [Candidatus Nomurabacteria bacterium]